MSKETLPETMATAPAAPRNIIQHLEQNAPAIGELIPKEAGPITPRLLLDQLSTRMNQTPALKNCTPESIKNAVKNCALLGLQPGYGGNTAEVYLIPYKSQCTLEIGYKGYETIVMRSGRYKRLTAYALWEGDHFTYRDRSGSVEFEYEDGREHKVLTGAFAYAVDHEGFVTMIHMTSDEIDALEKKTRKGANMTPAWKDWPDRMYRKTVIRRLANELPKTPPIPLLERLHSIDVGEPRSAKQIMEGLD